MTRPPQPTRPISCDLASLGGFFGTFARWSVLWLLLASLVTAQEPEDQHGIFIDTVDVHLVNVEVVATRKDGTPASGLKQEDFKIFEDGELVEIANFYAVEAGRSSLEIEQTSQEQDLHHPAPPPPDPRPLNLVILVDSARIRPTTRNRVFDGLKEHLDRLLRPGDHVAVVDHDRTVNFEQTFSSDRALVNAALDRLRDKAVMPRTAGEYRGLLRGIETATPVGGSGLSKSDPALEASILITSIRQYSQRTQDHVKQTVRLLDSLLGSIAGLPGRKAVFYLTDGLELRPGEGLYTSWWDKYSSIATQVNASPPETEALRYDGTASVQDLVATASAAGVAFYTLGENPSSNARSAEMGQLRSSTAVYSEALAQQESLVELAQSTGGYSLSNGSGGVDTLLERLSQDFQNFYSLAYVSPHHGDGKRHRVRVEVEDKGIRLRYLERYRDKSSEERMIDRTTSALLLDRADNPLEIRLEVGKEKREKKDRYLLPILVRIPIGKIALLPSGDQHVGSVTIYLVVRDQEGRLSEPHQAILPIEIPNDQLLEAVASSAGYATKVLVRSGEQKIAIGVRDEVGAVSATVNLVVDIGNSG